MDGLCFDIATAGLDLNPVPYNSGDDANRDMAAGNVDLSVGGYDQREVPFPGEGTQAFCLREYKELRDYQLNQGVLKKDYDDLK